jgi:hypothetical protein
MAFLTAEQKKEQGLIHAGFDHTWMIRRELKNGKVARVALDFNAAGKPGRGFQEPAPLRGTPGPTAMLMDSWPSA